MERPPSWFEIECQLCQRVPDFLPGTFDPALVYRRVHCVRRAFGLAQEEAARNLLRRFGDLELSAILDTLLDSLADMGKLLATTTLVGTGLGAAGGALLGGVGAVPGAVFGGGLGLRAGIWLLGVLGLASLVDFIVDGLPRILDGYVQGIRIAYTRPTPSFQGPLAAPADWQDEQSAKRGAFFIATSHEAMVVLLLSALVAYLTRGRGDAAKLASEMRATPAGTRLAQWMLKHEEQLKRHPALQGPKPSRGAASAEEARPAAPREANRPGRIARTPRHEVKPCFDASRLPQRKVGEFDRQLQGQQGGLNDMTVAEYLEGRRAFKAGETVRSSQTAKGARERYMNRLANKLERTLQAEGYSPEQAPEQARRMAQEQMNTLAALHQPDLTAGGWDRITGFGDRQVNASIGGQWRKRLPDLDSFAQSIPEPERAHTKLDIRLIRCGKG